MNTNQEDRLINSIMAGATIVAFIACLIISKDSYSDSFFENLLMVLFYLVCSFFIGNIVIGIPIAIIYYLTTHTFEDFYEISNKKRIAIIGILALVICIIVALIIT